MKKFTIRILTVSIVIIITAAIAGYAFRASLGTPLESYPKRAVYAPNGAIATSQPLASQAGLSVLKNGGNAVDAAVTAAAVLSVVEPYMSGIGGDMLALYWNDNDKRLIGLNASGRSGSLMTRAALSDVMRVPGDGPKTITVPGALSGWNALLEKYGTISLKEALQPAIELAKDGFPISEVTASEWKIFEGLLQNDSSATSTFLINGTRSPEVGEWFKNPDYARTLEEIAAKGSEYFYSGELSKYMATYIQSKGGFITEDDLKNHNPVWVEPMSLQYGDYKVWQMPPNSQGISVLEMLAILETTMLENMDHNAPDYLHLLIEAKKLAFADLEISVGDPDWMKVNTANLLEDTFTEARRELINTKRAMTQAEPHPTLTNSETTYLTVADREGNMISFISSLAGSFGSGVVVPGTGFALQNRGVGFTYEQGRVNTIAPNTLPFHTIVPGFVTRTDDQGVDNAWLSYGFVGGPQQPPAQVQFLLNVIQFGMNVQEALDAPRFRHWTDNRVSFESAIPPETVDALREMEHRPQNPIMETAQTIYLGPNGGLTFGCGQAIMKNMRGYIAGSDSRRDGLAAGH